MFSQVHVAGGQTSVRDLLSEGDLQPHQEKQLHHPLGKLTEQSPRILFFKLPPPTSHNLDLQLCAAHQPGSVLPHQANAAR